MARDPEIQEILLRIDLVDLIGGAIKLSRAGRSFKGLCPFHAEKTPSFHVYPADGVKPGFYHCFGCKKGGDALTFLVEREGLAFQEALEQLARRAGVELAKHDRPAHQRRQNRFEVLDQCQSHFRSNLKNHVKGKVARDYLERRSISPELWDRFGLGLTLENWDALALSLGSNKEALQVAAEQGLIRKREGGSGTYDFFRNRLMFPIHSPAGQIIAFAGRDLAGDSNAKYMNSQETDLFKKGRVLYGLHQARGKMKESRRAIVVEGYFDVIRMHACGFEETVAPMGTALTKEHFELLERQAEEIVLLFDGDSAGRSAAVRSLAPAWDLKSTVKVGHLPGGVDPDEYLLSHPAEEMAALLEEAAPSFRYLVDSIVGTVGVETPERVRLVVSQVFESLELMQSGTLVALRLKQLSDRIGVPFESLRHDWDRMLRDQAARKGPKGVEKPAAGPDGLGRPSSSPSPEWEARRGLHVLLLQDESKLEEKVGEPFASHPIARSHLEQALEILGKFPGSDPLGPMIRAYLEEGPRSARQIWSEHGEDSLLWEVEAILREGRVPDNPLRTLEDYTDTLRLTQIEEELKIRSQAFKAAEESQDGETLGRIAARMEELAKTRDRIRSKSREVR
jgi:DNA primase